MSPVVKTWKIVDIVGQAAITLIFAYCYNYESDLSNYGIHIEEYNVYEYFLISIILWQFTSFMIHLPAIRADWVGGGRKFYGFMLVLIVLSGMLVRGNGDRGSGYIAALVVFFLTPVMALLYFIVCLLELQDIPEKIGTIEE